MTSTRNAGTAGASFNEDYVTTLTATTKGAASNDGAAKKVIDTRNLSEEDLEALKTQDPFLYYSIPRPVRRNSGSAFDVSTTQCNPDPESTRRSCSRRASCPYRVESSSFMVERKTCVSFECHTDLALEDFMDDTDSYGNEDGDDLDTDKLFDQLVIRYAGPQQYCVTSLYESTIVEWKSWVLLDRFVTHHFGYESLGLFTVD